MAKLQLACDMVKLDALLEMMPELIKCIDIFEMGTPFCLRYGVEGIKKVHQAHPDATLLADIKIFDGGSPETLMYTECGASYVTVMSRTNNLTIKACADACHASGAKCVVDMMCETDFEKRVPELEALGADILAVHVAYDDYMATGMTPLKSLEQLSKVVKTAKTAVAGGIKLANIKDYLAFNPEIIIVGGSILGSETPIDTAQLFANAIH